MPDLDPFDIGANFWPTTDVLPTYHCYWCGVRVVGQSEWDRHGKTCKPAEFET